MKNIVITNNPKVFEHYKELSTVVFLEGETFLGVLNATRDMVHKGHKLLTHPLTSSLKPNETPYKSIIISSKNETLDLDSLKLIEGSIEVAKKFIQGRPMKAWNDSILADFQLIDYYIICKEG